jgi:thymidylate kinase
MTEPAKIVDAAAPRRVLVFGSHPGSGRDLDLLVRDDDRPAIEQALEASGFRNKGIEWVRFRDCTAEAVDLVPASAWTLPAPELERFYESARPLNGFERLVVPAPEHALLVLARLTGRSGGLPEKRRPRLEAALADRPNAWDLARNRADAWSLGQELEHLERAYRQPRDDRRRLRRPRRPRVVALSGIDGSGKSSQARALKTSLERLGYESAVEWSPFGQNAWLNVIGRPAKRLVKRLRPAEPVSATGLERTSGTALRERNPAANYLWSAVVTLANGIAQLRTIVGHSRHGRLVIYDRYSLDSTVQLRFRYGADRRFRLQRALIRLLAPRPIAAFYLEIPPETSLDRKDDRWTLDDLAAQSELYREEYAAAGSTRLDGLRPADELAAQIAEAVWRALS